MYQNVNFSDFCDAFRELGREDAFSYEGKRALFDYLEDLENDIGEPIELDVIGFCCDFTEYESLDAFREDYGEQYRSIDAISADFTVIPVDGGGFIIQG